MTESTACPDHCQRTHRQPKLHLEKWCISMNGSKFQCISRDRLYTELYGPTTLQYWHKKDNVPLDLSQILWEESRLAGKRMASGQRRIDTKLLCNQYGLGKALWQHKHQDGHSCPVCSAPMEDQNHLFICPHVKASRVFKKGLEEMETIWEELETKSTL